MSVYMDSSGIEYIPKEILSQIKYISFSHTICTEYKMVIVLLYRFDKYIYLKGKRYIIPP